MELQTQIGAITVATHAQAQARRTGTQSAYEWAILPNDFARSRAADAGWCELMEFANKYRRRDISQEFVNCGGVYWTTVSIFYSFVKLVLVRLMR